MEHGVDEPGDPPKGDWGQVTVAKALLCIAIALALPLGLGLLARLHPAFDAAAHFRIHLAVLLALVALPLLFTSFWWQGGAVLLLVLAALATVLAPWALFGPTRSVPPAALVPPPVRFTGCCISTCATTTRITTRCCR